MDEKCCGTCRFWASEWQDEKNSDVAECIRFPPKIVMSINDADETQHNISRATMFPVLSYVRVCGEWKPNDKLSGRGEDA